MVNEKSILDPAGGALWFDNRKDDDHKESNHLEHQDRLQPAVEPHDGGFSIGRGIAVRKMSDNCSAAFSANS